MPLLDKAPKSFDDYASGGGGRGLEIALGAGPEAVIDEVAKSGLRGRGGAGFPTGEKWRSIRSTGTGTRFAVCNGAETEGIPVDLRGEGGEGPYPVGPAELLVPSRFEAQARRVLEQAERGSDSP